MEILMKYLVNVLIIFLGMKNSYTQNFANAEIDTSNGLIIYKFLPTKFDTCLSEIYLVTFNELIEKKLDVVEFYDSRSVNYDIIFADTTLERYLGKAESYFVSMINQDSLSNLRSTELLKVMPNNNGKKCYGSNEIYTSRNFGDSSIYIIFNFEGIINKYHNCNFFRQFNSKHGKVELDYCGLYNLGDSEEFAVLSYPIKITPLSKTQIVELNLCKFATDRLCYVVYY